MQGNKLSAVNSASHWLPSYARNCWPAFVSDWKHGKNMFILHAGGKVTLRSNKSEPMLSEVEVKGNTYNYWKPGTLISDEYVKQQLGTQPQTFPTCNMASTISSN